MEKCTTKLDKRFPLENLGPFNSLKLKNSEKQKGNLFLKK
jgi:hypothetical protein